ncbi:Asp-tRNA(Asn)/Glu-tRNA(Gln) amidotransferase subunit GatC [Salibacter sp.]|uniref:Asp-tRNA(Asn)/Glu-tRNA(Gln) amidotransferase subunit GatC n=1 Tax=Salibacter sp. TaxID=2010995 RepID=UPI00287074DB|nr:Asp-tRNA(Asn)/Glu-tRNA(Gln) amidotransferase subunit GatC [Salibacter sp.]MDR9399522.1 Asp-tRNA(Asn)/Glu-tRNA(Gln) amidotransferase subunit GatC [Salibacter sp.]MDR9487787.1 Asp-tRNA(Asn)/Glu-tRNA(Gln) amidotransferase subunit GatC [Salibacter sp.]
MEVNDELVDKIAALAKLEFKGEEKEAIKGDMQRILNFIDKLGEVDTEGVEPLVYMTDESLKLRADEVDQNISQDEALRNAPDKDSDYFKVPKVLKK